MTETQPETVVIAVYSSRQDAEIAQELLEDKGIRASIGVDDAGTMYPQLQQTQGVRLAVLGDEGAKARWVLKEADLLPEGSAPPHEQADGAAGSRQGYVLGMALVLLAIVLALFITALL